jgi:hypothetical protein
MCIFKKKKINVLVGAGAVVNIDGANTEDLTKDIVNKTFEYKGSQSKILSKVYEHLNRYCSATTNFEDIMHVLEMLKSYGNNWKEEPHSKSPVAPFIKLTDKDLVDKDFFDESELSMAIDNLINVIIEKIKQYQTDFQNPAKYKWYKSFWNNSQVIWDITTLNYDNTIEQSLGDNYDDGFEKTGYPCWYKFNCQKLLNAKGHKVSHLHGNILFGKPFDDGGSYDKYKDEPQDLYKRDASKNDKGLTFTSKNTQSGDMIPLYPIIVGLRKTEKILPEPFNSYFYNFENGIYNNNRLLIIGYGLGDEYINNVITKMNKIHGDNKRVVIINYYKERAEVKSKEYLFYCKMLEDCDFYCGNYNKVQINQKGNVRIYLNGFKDAITPHGDEIIDFLSR